MSSAELVKKSGHTEALALVMRMRAALEMKISGQSEAIELSLVALLAGGHALLEGPPGIGKTSLAQGIASLLRGVFHRVQMTSDLLPSDIVGVLRIKPGGTDFEFRPGPIFSNVLLADELNRTGAKTQAALLEAMAEGKVSVDGITYPLPQPFFVIATQNPQEFQGVYPLSESQLDRFMVHVSMQLPDREAELNIYKNHSSNALGLASETKEVFSPETFKKVRDLVSEVFVEESLLAYAQKIAFALRAIDEVAFGASVRSMLQLIDAAKARAFLCEREFVIPDDIRFLAPSVLGHRLCLKGVDAGARQRKEIVREAVDSVPSPK